MQKEPPLWQSIALIFLVLSAIFVGLLTLVLNFYQICSKCDAALRLQISSETN